MIPTAETITIGAVFLYFVNEFFKYLKTRRGANNNGRDFNKDIQDINLKIARIDLELGNDVSHLKENMRTIRTDIAIMKDRMEDIKMIKNEVNDIKIALKKQKNPD